VRARPGAHARGQSSSGRAALPNWRAQRAWGQPDPTGGGDGEDGALHGIHRVAAATLDLDVGGRDRLDGDAQPGPVPSGNRSAGLVDLPGSHAEGFGDPGRRPAPGRTHLDQGAQLRGEDGDDRHRVDAGRDRVAQQPQCLARLTGQSGVGDPEAARLHLARVIGLDHPLIDDPDRVGDQLAAGRRELAQILADRLDQRLNGTRRDLATLPAELMGDEVGLVSVGLDRRALDDLSPGRLQRVESLLAALTGLVHDDEREVGCRCGDQREDVGLQLLAALVEVLDDDRLRPAEERRARMQAQNPALVCRSSHPDRFEVRLGVAQLGEHRGQGALGEQPFRAGDEDERRNTHARKPPTQR
jgi:hypothetical protein